MAASFPARHPGQTLTVSRLGLSAAGGDRLAEDVEQRVGVGGGGEVEALAPDRRTDPREEAAVAQLLAEVGDVGEEQADPAVAGQGLRRDDVAGVVALDQRYPGRDERREPGRVVEVVPVGAAQVAAVA